MITIHRGIAVLAVSALFAVATHAQMPGEPPASNTQIPPEIIKPAPGPDDARISKQAQGVDAEFVDRARLADVSEVQASQIALEKSTSPDVRAFAKQMVGDHGKANERLRALAARKGVPEQTVRIVNPDVEALRDRSGRDFDTAYVSAAGPDAHREAIRLFENEARDGKDPDLRAYAKATLPTLRHHLAAAQVLERKVGAQ
ncbi:DUF4142 domain-containing protein [Burkholderia sp. Bp8963]|uniref:DUF4142 domain-containing protein n=1 Tax=Burkholderia sp. Bp8963 TaxID=2184547 RepID=UPI000F5B08EB|nr:DUF4142 domain-containing protein [Burkholderia sp. Bp8963]RQS58415.1 DUF4142 domain-containing protein [Burkholderia sp. Bp8963]